MEKYEGYFKMLDQDGNGRLSKDEFMALLEDPQANGEGDAEGDRRLLLL